ncbi:MAG: phosphate signaling complex protein PhoU [Candidatus Sumerlaeia bacterium]
MPRHLIKEMDKLKRKMMGLSAVVEERLMKAVKALMEQDEALAHEVIESDVDIDEMEVEVEEECLKMLALYQPVAHDLRMIVAILKMNNDLERIGDLAVNVAERSLYLISVPKQNYSFLDFRKMASKTQSMLRRSLDSLVNLDGSEAGQVCTDDSEVDEINREMYDLVKQEIREHPENLEELIHCLSISRHMERIADLATNIAEDVIYMVSGKIVRHKAEDYRRSHPAEKQ